MNVEAETVTNDAQNVVMNMKDSSMRLPRIRPIILLFHIVGVVRNVASGFTCTCAAMVPSRVVRRNTDSNVLLC